jgi:hypothetical protein
MNNPFLGLGHFVRVNLTTREEFLICPKNWPTKMSAAFWAHGDVFAHLNSSLFSIVFG